MDIRTLLVCYLALLALHTVVLLLTRFSHRDVAGTGWMAGAFACVTIGAALGAARGYVPDLASIVIGNASIMLGYLLLHRAITDFLNLSRRHVVLGLVLLAAVVAGTVYFTYGVSDLQSRIVLVSVAYAAQVSLSAYLLLRTDNDGGTRMAERFLGVVLSGLAILNVLRAGLTLWYGARTDLMQSDLVQAVSLLAFILLSTAIAFGFIWMTGARLHVALHRQANLDPLTGLLNRRGFLSVAPVRLRTAEQEGRSVILLFADLDGLKQVNDTAGHDVGDRAICGAAEVLRDVLRASDSIARLGGDEFCALIPVRDPADGEIILRRLEDRTRAHNARPGREYSVGISAATVPINPAEGRSLDDLLRDVDRSMYATKQARRRGVPL